MPAFFQTVDACCCSRSFRVKPSCNCRSMMNVMESRKTCWILTSALLTTLVVAVETLVVAAEVVGEAAVDEGADLTATVTSIVVVSAMIASGPAPAAATVNAHRTSQTRWISRVWIRRWTQWKPELGPCRDIHRRWMKYLRWPSWSALEQWSYTMWFYCAGLLLCVPANSCFSVCATLFIRVSVHHFCCFFLETWLIWCVFEIQLYLLQGMCG